MVSRWQSNGIRRTSRKELIGEQKDLIQKLRESIQAEGNIQNILEAFQPGKRTTSSIPPGRAVLKEPTAKAPSQQDADQETLDPTEERRLSEYYLPKSSRLSTRKSTINHGLSTLESESSTIQVPRSRSHISDHRYRHHHHHR